MALRLIQFLAIMLTALALVPRGTHLAALPNKMAMAQAAYFIAQQIYAGWAALSRRTPVAAIRSRANRRLAQFVQQRGRLLKIDGVEALGEPAVDRRQQLARLPGPVETGGQQPGEAGRRAQFVSTGALLAGDRQRSAERGFGLHLVVPRRLAQ